MQSYARGRFTPATEMEHCSTNSGICFTSRLPASTKGYCFAARSQSATSMSETSWRVRFSGPGLVRAYLMEEREAVYPRIIVEEDVMERFTNDETLWKEDHSKSDEAGYVTHMLKTDEAVWALLTTLARSRRRWITTGNTLRSSDVTRSWLNEACLKPLALVSDASTSG